MTIARKQGPAESLARSNDAPDGSTLPPSLSTSSASSRPTNVAPSLAKLQARLRTLRLEQTRGSNLDFLAHARGKMDETTLDWRRERRAFAIEELEHEIIDWQDDCVAEEARERQTRRRTRWHGFAYAAMRAFPYYRGLDLTKGQRAVLTALGAASKGKSSFEVAHAWIAMKAGVSETTVKTTIRRLDDEGLLLRTERRIRGKAMNLWNRYSWRCERLADWARKLFSPLLSYSGGENPPSPPKGDSSYATEETNAQSVRQISVRATPCRQKALRHDEGRGAGELSEDWALVARGAMRELGYDLSPALSPDDVAKAVEDLKSELQPGFKDFFWRKALWAHGRGCCLMAFLETRLVRNMRRVDIPDSRPWNEREPIRNVDSYLWGILKKKPGECRPEITVIGKLDKAGVYDLPPALLEKVRRHAAARAGLHRHVSSAG